ncbi:hypothetical protein AAZX31_10G184000 [Glycine max]
MTLHTKSCGIYIGRLYVKAGGKPLDILSRLNEMWRFAFVLHGPPEYLQDSDIVFDRFQRRDIYGVWEQYLGLEHDDSAPKKSYAVNQNRHTFEKPVKIYN